MLTPNICGCRIKRSKRLGILTYLSRSSLIIIFFRFAVQAIAPFCTSFITTSITIVDFNHACVYSRRARSTGWIRETISQVKRTFFKKSFSKVTYFLVFQVLSTVRAVARKLAGYQRIVNSCCSAVLCCCDGTRCYMVNNWFRKNLEIPYLILFIRYKAWHSWAYMNFEAVLFYKHQGQNTSANQTLIGENGNKGLVNYKTAIWMFSWY